MKSPTTTTAIMGLVAGLVSALAAWFYPWPEVAARSDLVGKPLFESFEANDVRTITVTEYDADRNGVNQISLRRSGDTWVIPARQNFIANDSQQISQAINSVNASVLEIRSNDLQDHVEFGVIDPLEFESTPARNSLGRKIVLQDRNNRELASLIVGSSPRDDANVNQTRRFVRIAGKPGVYVVELPFDALTTDFSRWVSPNLFEISDGSEIQKLLIQSFQRSKEQLKQSDNPKTWRYELDIDVPGNQRALRTPNLANELTKVVISAEQLRTIQQIGLVLTNVQFSDARKKNKALADALKRPSLEIPKELLDRLNQSGFTVVDQPAAQNAGLKLESTAGKLVLQKTNGVTISLLVGDLVETQSGAGADLNRLVMFYASSDPGFFPEPAKPAEGANESEQKSYLRKVANRNSKIEEANEFVRLLNNYYADWYFVVSEQVIGGLIPELGIELRATRPAADQEAVTPLPPKAAGPTDPFEGPNPNPAAIETPAKNNQAGSGASSAKPDDQ
jgi:hypothetical protein